MNDEFNNDDIVVIIKIAEKKYHGVIGILKKYDIPSYFYGYLVSSSLEYGLYIESKTHIRKANDREIFLYKTYGADIFPLGE